MNFRYLLTAISAVVLVSTGLAADPATSPTKKPECCSKELAAGTPLSDRSVYQLDSSWTNDAGAAMKLASLRGRPQVVAMFFASCQFTCPILVNDMKRIEAALPESMRTNVGFVLLSFDAARDTPAALTQYRKTHGLAANWTLLHGAPDDVLELAALLGVKFKKDARGDFAHSNLITILDAKGESVFQQSGLNRDPAPTISAVEKLF